MEEVEAVAAAEVFVVEVAAVDLAMEAADSEAEAVAEDLAMKEAVVSATTAVVSAEAAVIVSDLTTAEVDSVAAAAVGMADLADRRIPAEVTVAAVASVTTALGTPVFECYLLILDASCCFLYFSICLVCFISET